MSQAVADAVADFTAVIADLSAECNSSGVADESAAIEHVTQRLLGLESTLEGFDALPLVALLRRQLQELVAVKTGEGPEDDVVTQASGGAVASWRQQMLSSIQHAALAVPDDAIAFPRRFAAGRGGPGGLRAGQGQQSLWFQLNFDDDAVFEPLDVTLSLLKAEETVEKGLDKLLSTDVCDFLEHPLWKEMLLLLRSTLGHTNDAASSKAATLHIRLIRGLQGLQVVDLALSALDFLFQSFAGALETQSIEPRAEATISYSEDRVRVHTDSKLVQDLQLLLVSASALSQCDYDRRIDEVFHKFCCVLSLLLSDRTPAPVAGILALLGLDGTPISTVDRQWFAVATARHLLSSKLLQSAYTHLQRIPQPDAGSIVRLPWGDCTAGNDGDATEASVTVPKSLFDALHFLSVADLLSTGCRSIHGASLAMSELQQRPAAEGRLLEHLQTQFNAALQPDATYNKLFSALESERGTTTAADLNMIQSALRWVLRKTVTLLPPPPPPPPPQQQQQSELLGEDASVLPRRVADLICRILFSVASLDDTDVLAAEEVELLVTGVLRLWPRLDREQLRSADSAAHQLSQQLLVEVEKLCVQSSLLSSEDDEKKEEQDQLLRTICEFCRLHCLLLDERGALQLDRLAEFSWVFDLLAIVLETAAASALALLCCSVPFESLIPPPSHPAWCARPVRRLRSLLHACPDAYFALRTARDAAKLQASLDCAIRTGAWSADDESFVRDFRQLAIEFDVSSSGMQAALDQYCALAAVSASSSDGFSCFSNLLGLSPADDAVEQWLKMCFDPVARAEQPLDQDALFAVCESMLPGLLRLPVRAACIRHLEQQDLLRNCLDSAQIDAWTQLQREIIEMATWMMCGTSSDADTTAGFEGAIQDSPQRHDDPWHRSMHQCVHLVARLLGLQLQADAAAQVHERVVRLHEQLDLRHVSALATIVGVMTCDVQDADGDAPYRHLAGLSREQLLNGGVERAAVVEVAARWKGGALARACRLQGIDCSSVLSLLVEQQLVGVLPAQELRTVLGRCVARRRYDPLLRAAACALELALQQQQQQQPRTRSGWPAVAVALLRLGSTSWLPLNELFCDEEAVAIR